MSRLARALCSFHGAAFLWFAYCAVQSAHNGATWAVWLFVAASVLTVISVIREAEIAEERRAAAGAADLNAACCERWWTSLATDHDPTCRNQTRRSAA